MATQIKLRRDTGATWTANNTVVLAAGEPGFETDTGLLKIGDGTSTWSTLEYIVDLSAVNQNILPSVDSDGTTGYTLGSPDFKWKELFVSNGSIYIGDVKLSNVGGKLVATKVINPGEENEEEDPEDSDAASEIGGGGGTSQLYLELTDTPFITQPVVLGTPVTAVASIRGQDALVSVTIGSGEGPFIDSITIDTPGNGYVVGQRYRINYWQVGGNDDADNIIFEVGTVGPAGTLLTVVNQVFEGTFTASNTPATYTGVSFDYIATEFDEVDTGLTLARGAAGGFFNSEEEFSYNSSVSPIGTLWNADGWETLVGFNSRTYDTFDSILFGPDNAPPPELVMWDTINDKYYKFGMNVWGIDNNEYSYTRTLITDPNYFKKTDGLEDGEVDNIKPQPEETLQLEMDYLEAEQLWVDVRDQDAADIAPDTRPWDGMPSYQAYDILIATFPIEPAPLTGDLVPRANNAKNAYLAWQEAREEAIGITRGNNGAIYNPYREGSWNSNTSPSGTAWNLDGWDDLTNLGERTYVNFYDAYSGNQLGGRIPGSKAIMYVPEINKYYAIDWISWTQGGDYGGFSYTRREIDLTKLDQGVRFADGTVQTTAYIDTNVVSTAPGERRIETVSGYKQVAVTGKVYTGSLEAIATGSNAINRTQVNVTKTQELTAVYNSQTPVNLEVSVNETAWYPAYIGGSSETTYQLVFENNVPLPLDTDDVIFYRTYTGGESVVWWDKDDLPGGSANFRGAVIDYHAYTNDGTIIGTIHIVDDDGDEHIAHTEVSSGDSDIMYDNLWIVFSEGQIRYSRVDGNPKTLKIQWTARVFYGNELYD